MPLTLITMGIQNLDGRDLGKIRLVESEHGFTDLPAQMSKFVSTKNHL